MNILRLLFIFTLLFSSTIFASTITVQGQNNSNVDRAAIQSAINSASSGDVIKLMGVFQLDGQQIFINKSNLTIQGAGAAGNWSTVINGQTTGGIPNGDINGNYNNRGFGFGPTTGIISNVTIQNIKFTGLNRAISVSPSFQTTSTNCSAITITQGSANNINIQNNWFDNDIRAVDSFGTSNHVSVINNLLSNIQSRGILFIGTITTCSPFPPGYILIGLPKFTNISGNTIQNDTSDFPIEVLAADNLTVSNNTIINSNNFVPIVVQGITNSIVSKNAVEGGSNTLSGIFAETIIGADLSWPVQVEPIQNSKIMNNQIKNSLIGIIVDNAVSTLSVSNNQFSHSGFVDIFLCEGNADGLSGNFCDFYFSEFGPTPPSSNNTVITTNFSNSVIDLGTNNKLLGTQKLLNNPNVPQSIKNKLINGAIGRMPLN